MKYYISPHTGSVQTFTATNAGTYKLEVWGAQGGSTLSGVGANGGYSYGNIYFYEGRLLYVVVGGSGDSGLGYNGGGDGQGYGGGATHISTNNRGELSNYSSYQSEIIIVAGGGGGGERTNAGAGGGVKGDSGVFWSTGGTTGNAPTGGTQNSGGIGAWNNTYGTAGSGTFGKGGTGTTSNESGPGGGGGWYGGGGIPWAGGAAGGSGHIGTGITGATIAGNQSFLSPSGGTEIGHTGNGYSRITQISF